MPESVELETYMIRNVNRYKHSCNLVVIKVALSRATPSVLWEMCPL